jgi:DNA-binding transcriptional LysR family regulator
LEERVGAKLLNRTTRSVAPTEAGSRLLARLAPAFANIAEAIEDLNTIRERPSGIVRLNVPRMAAHMVLAPAFGRFNQAYPDVHLEVAVEEAFTDIVARGFDAGVRLGESVQRDMIAVRITPDLRIAIVCSPDYLAGRFVPDSPRDLREHACIGYRQPASGARYRWEFARDGQEIEVAVEGPLTLDDPDLMIAAALDGLGLAYAMEGRVTEHLSSGRLVRVLTDWCPPFPGFFLYYPSRRQMPAALRALIDFLRVRVDHTERQDWDLDDFRGRHGRHLQL